MITVKCTGADLPIIEQSRDGFWGECHFVWNNANVKECDYWFIFDGYGLDKDNEAICPPENVYFVMAEAEGIQTYNKSFIKQFHNLITVQRNRYNVPHVYYKCLAPWFVGLKFSGGVADRIHYKPYRWLETMGLDIKKTKLLSIVSSNKQMSEGHRQRLCFVSKVKEYFGNQVDFFGRGINEFADKWDVVAPYKYHIAIENYVCDDYITEKFYDPVLAGSYPIYHGAKNIGNYFDSRSYIQIDINQPEKAIKTIEEIINSDTYEKNKQYLIESRKLILNKYNIFNEITDIIRLNNYSSGIPRINHIQSENKLIWRIENKLRRILFEGR